MPQSSLESDLYQWHENSLVSLPKTPLEDALFQFLKQANLLQYYSAFLEQGLNPTFFINPRSIHLGGDDLKQLAEAENDDFQEIIILVGMVSKPLHVKRFKKALEDYRQSLHQSYSSLSSRRRSTEETFSDRHLFPSHLHPNSTNHSSNWSLNVSWRINLFERNIFLIHLET